MGLARESRELRDGVFGRGGLRDDLPVVVQHLVAAEHQPRGADPQRLHLGQSVGGVSGGVSLRAQGVAHHVLVHPGRAGLEGDRGVLQQRLARAGGRGEGQHGVWNNSGEKRAQKPVGKTVQGLDPRAAEDKSQVSRRPRAGCPRRRSAGENGGGIALLHRLAANTTHNYSQANVSICGDKTGFLTKLGTGCAARGFFWGRIGKSRLIPDIHRPTILFILLFFLD